MKIIKIFGKLALLIVGLSLTFSSCSKLQESPDIITDNGNPSGGGGTGGGGGGGGGNTGNPDVYLGLWKLTGITEDGVTGSVDEYFTVKLDAASKAEWQFFDPMLPFPIVLPDIYTLNAASANPRIISFTSVGTREIVNKTGSQIVWKYTEAGVEIVETLTKQ